MQDSEYSFHHPAGQLKKNKIYTNQILFHPCILNIALLALSQETTIEIEWNY